MVAKIESGKSLTGALNYNEHKVKAGKAELIAVSGYASDYDQLSFSDKLFRLKDRAEQNIRTKTNTVHLSLNFDVSEKLETGKLVNIADEYMKRIGFENQPYLVYRHFDAGHPHMHIVSTNIEADGKRISLHNIGELRSEPARKSIEIDFCLVQAGTSKNDVKQNEEVKIKPLVYGQMETKRAITNIVNGVIRTYMFTSLPEFNAILNFYHVTADRGAKESVMFDKGGLRYWAIDKSSNRIGVPTKAGSIYKKPTLKLLEERFRLNEFLRRPFKDQLKRRIDKAILMSVSLTQFEKELKNAGIDITIRRNADGRIYGLSYIDQLNHVIFNGSDLGKSYSAAAIVDALNYKSSENLVTAKGTTMKKDGVSHDINSRSINTNSSRGLLDELLNPYGTAGDLQGEFGPMKKRKKRRKLNL